MKKKLFSIMLLVLIITSGFSQITFETYYDAESFKLFHINHDDKYCLTDMDNKVISIFNSDHTEFAEYDINNLGEGYGDYEIEKVINISDSLFFLDNKVEIMVSLVRKDEIDWEYAILIFNEDYEIKFKKDGVNEGLLYTMNSDSKMMLYFDYNNPITDFRFYIYSLPGIYTFEADNSIMSIISSYPNPSNNKINIPVKYNTKAILDLFDINGKLILHKEFNGKGEEITIRISNLNSGFYIANIEADGKLHVTKILVN